MRRLTSERISGERVRIADRTTNLSCMRGDAGDAMHLLIDGRATPLRWARVAANEWHLQLGTLDAFVVRSLLLPAVLELLGRRTWMLPAWLERRLPHLAIDRPANPTPPTPSAEPALEGV